MLVIKYGNLDLDHIGSHRPVLVTTFPVQDFRDYKISISNAGIGALQTGQILALVRNDYMIGKTGERRTDAVMRPEPGYSTFSYHPFFGVAIKRVCPRTRLDFGSLMIVWLNVFPWEAHPVVMAAVIARMIERKRMTASLF